MTAPYDDLIRAFIAEGREELPDRAFDAVRGDIHRTRQRVVIGPWREPQMSNLAKVALAAAAVIAVAIGAIRLLPTAPNPGDPVPSPTPSQSAQASAATSPGFVPNGQICGQTCDNGLVQGSYTYMAGDVSPVPLSFVVPAGGWYMNEWGFVTKHDALPGGVLFTTWNVTHVFEDICTNGALVDAGTSAAELADAIAAQKNQVATETTDAEVGGLPALQLEVSLSPDVDDTCDTTTLRPWPDPGPDINGGYCCVPPAAISRYSIVEVGDKRVIVIARRQPGSSPADVAELDGIVESITFPAPSGSPVP